MDIETVQERFRAMGISYPLRPFGIAGDPLCTVLRWSDFLGGEQRLSGAGADALQTFLMHLELERVPRIGEGEDCEILAGIAAIAQVPPLPDLVGHLLANLSEPNVLSGGSVATVLNVLRRVASRCPELRSALVAFARHAMEPRGVCLAGATWAACLAILASWGDADDLGLLLDLYRRGEKVSRLQVLQTLAVRSLLDDPRIDAMVGSEPLWRDLLVVLRGGDFELFQPRLGIDDWMERQNAALLAQDLAVSHPQKDLVFEMVLERIFEEDDSDVQMALGWALGTCLAELGADAAEAAIERALEHPEGLSTRAGFTVLRALVRLPVDDATRARILSRLDEISTGDDRALKDSLGVVRAHFHPDEEVVDDLAQRLASDGDWIADLADPRLPVSGQLETFLAQRHDVDTGLWIALGSEARVGLWVRSWEMARLAWTNPDLASTLAIAVVPSQPGGRRNIAAVGCAVLPGHVAVDPVYLACALHLPASGTLPDTPETAGALIGLLGDSGISEQARAQLCVAGPLVRSMWRKHQELQQMNTYDREARFEARSYLFASDAPLPKPIPIARSRWFVTCGMGQGLDRLRFLGLVPGSDPVRNAARLEDVSEIELLRQSVSQWTDTVENACVAWTAYLGRGDWEGREAACLLAHDVPLAFWESPEGELRLKHLMELRGDADPDVVAAATTACERWGVEPLEGAAPPPPRKRRRR